ncbi:ABC transporter ATP-binding protein [Gordonia humi]|uniref:ATP-binding cassette subfamily B protein n=1 Tax=Gordonia humi TaxID=686429 RepID=A0A840ESU9_9ACTN|nr:ABC transporter ATP-binding protein [Gordonia humi]MBB4134621.1 ATP-binding cassette subfamily B protein [Gordonia humi]
MITLLRRMWAMYPTERRGTALIAVGSLTTAVGEAALAVTVAGLMSSVLSAGRPAGWLVSAVVAAIVYVAVSAWTAHSVVVAARDRLDQTHRMIADKLPDLPMSWFDSQPTAASVALAKRAGDAASVAGHAFATAVSAAVPPVLVGVALLWFDWRAALTVLIGIPLSIGLSRFMTARSARVRTAEAEADRDVDDRVIEFATKQRTIRSSGLPDAGVGRLETAFARQHARSRASLRHALVGVNAGALVLGAALAVMLVLVAHPLDDVATTIAAVVIGANALRIAAAVPGTVLLCGHTVTELDAVAAMLSTPTPPDGIQTAAPTDRARPAIEMSGVRFTYGDETAPVFDGLSLSIPVGGLTAVVGPSGSGKSTLFKLIARHVDPGAGSVAVNGVDVRELTRSALSSLIAVVPQDVYLFDDSIERNIRLGAPAVDEARLRAAAGAARVDEIAARFPDGWDGRVGEGGRLLSGGERQRVSIARAIVKDAPILLLDEITSALDNHNQSAVDEVIDGLRTDRTLVVIAHRLETIAGADHVIFLEDGEVVEQGAPDQLLAAGARYADFHDQRSRALHWSIV